jgi:hypothetical protein
MMGPGVCRLAAGASRDSNSRSHVLPERDAESIRRRLARWRWLVRGAVQSPPPSWWDHEFESSLLQGRVLCELDSSPAFGPHSMQPRRYRRPLRAVQDGKVRVLLMTLRSARAISVTNHPGVTALTVTPRRPSSIANRLVSRLRPECLHLVSRFLRPEQE